MSAMLTLSTRDSTPPSSRHHCIMGTLSSAEELVYLQEQKGRENETEKKRRERSSCWYLFIYRTEDAGSITMLAVLVCARRKRALGRSAFF